jgi:hypothetical protein
MGTHIVTQIATRGGGDVAHNLLNCGVSAITDESEGIAVTD